jgi:predicted Zn-dependent protease with MMP-like domain
MEPVPLERFEELVGQAMDQVPDELFEQFHNVVVLVEDQDPEEPELLGLYDGIPLTERDDISYGGVMPDVIHIYRLPICRLVDDEQELIDEVYITVVHEFAHHLGIDDDRLHELGWA